MSPKADFALRGRNPDVLTCIANLSNDEVFTPPDFANEMLNALTEGWAEASNGANIWADKNVKFLDPCTKSGVFLREITRRLTEGLADEIPNLKKRVEHILTKQVFGIGITHLTSLLARRSVYCSKHVTGKHSIAKSFENDDGNIWFERLEHTWIETKCKFCGAPKALLNRGEELENYAYAFIHTEDIRARLAELFGGNMQFDVIIGNPPYQLQDGGHAASATPIYHKFVEQAIKLEPRFLSMVTPSRWLVGGRGLDEFRAKMLNEQRLRALVDFIVEKDAFPNINLNGGINFFLWDRSHQGDCQITMVEPGGIRDLPVTRSLNEYDVFIRRNQAVTILRKVKKKGETTFDSRVSSLRPFGLRTNFFGSPSPSSSKQIKLHSSGKTTWVSRSEIPTKLDWIDKWKVLIAAATDGNENYPLPIWDQRGPFIAGPGEACTETYLVAAVASGIEEAEHIRSYMRTKFFRFLVSLRKIAQHNKADNFSFVPDIPMNRCWTDSDLFKRYGIRGNEVEFIESMIRELSWSND